MAQLRVETVTYPDTGKVYAELYYPENEVIPIATTEPVYSNNELAIKHAREIFENWMLITQQEELQ